MTRLVLLLSVFLTPLWLIEPNEAFAQENSDAHIISIVDAFHGALASGDSTLALSFLAEDAIILESGGIEDREHYRTGHLAADIRFARAVSRERGQIRVTREGDVAWAHSRSTSKGKMGDREIDSRGAELMVLSRTNGEWKIRAIHWSSR